MKTLLANTSARWINGLIEIEAALDAVVDLRPMVPHDVWQKVHNGYLKAMAMRTELLAHAITDVAVETRTTP